MEPHLDAKIGDSPVGTPRVRLWFTQVERVGLWKTGTWDSQGRDGVDFSGKDKHSRVKRCVYGCLKAVFN